MRRWSKLALTILLGTILQARPIAAQDAPAAAPAPAAASEYPDSEAGLQSLLESVFAAAAAHDKDKLFAYVAGFEMPDHAAWFATTFGPTEGARMEAKYASMLGGQNKRISESFEKTLENKRTMVRVRAIHKPEEIQGLWRAVMQAMVQPTTLYSAASRNPDQKDSFALGDFVYVNGGFRFVDTPVWQALSTVPPMRIRMGGNVSASSLQKRITPAYPDDAKAAHVSGTVRLHVIIAVDGTVKEVEVMQGDPLLTNAASEAVKQWKYRPTLLNGQPVEVDTTIDVVFSLRS